MIQNLFYTLLLFFINCVAFAQEESYIKYTVLKGETITQIAIKNQVTPYYIYKLNPGAKAGIKENDVLLIPTSKPNGAAAVTPPAEKKINNPNNLKMHIVQPKETIYSISKDYEVSADELQAENADVLTDGLKEGQSIKIPKNKVVPNPVTTVDNSKKTVTKYDKTVYHVVAARETKYSIAKKYGITVEELERKNKGVIESMAIGTQLIVSGNRPPDIAPKQEKPNNSEVVKNNSETVKTEPVKRELPTGPKKIAYANYEVKPKETMYSITTTLNISQEELIALNPALNDGLKTGMILKVPANGSMHVIHHRVHTLKDLTKSLNTQTRKNLVLLIPFNLTKIQADTSKVIAARLKKDAFLNMTLDFYSGVLMAVDSAKTLGLNIDVKIFDSEESKTTSNVANIIKNNNLQNADAIIGPFYQQNVEKTAELLAKNNIPVISPLTKEIGNSFSNLYQTMPPNEVGKIAMFDYMIAHNGNILVISDPKKMANKDFITAKYPNSKFVPLDDNGNVDPEILKSFFVSDRINYVVMDSEKTGMILSTTNVLLKEYANFQIQLVIIEQNDTLDFEEISLKRLTILKMLYPSLTRENNSPEALIFKNDYKKKNRIYPTQFAIRGFDITFDTMLRLSQNESFETLAQETTTQQIDSKFEYADKEPAGYVNKGIYIIEYQEDLSIKIVN